MNIRILVIAAALPLLSAFAQEKPAPAPAAPTAQPIPADQQEAISRQMILLQSAQMQANDARQRYVDAAKELETQRAAWEKTVADLQAKYNAKGCSLNVDKSWSCPDPPKKEK